MEAVLPVATPAPKPAPGVYSDGGLPGASAEAAAGASAVGSAAGAEMPVSPLVSPAPKPAPGVYSDGGPPGASAEAAAGASADGSAAGAGMPVSPLVSPAPEPAPGVSPDGGRSGVSTGAAAHTARDSVHRDATNPRRGATFLRLSGATSGNATEDAAVIAICCPGAAAPRPICCRSTTYCQSPRAVARTCSTYIYSALPITACATATGRLRRRSSQCSAASELLARRSTRLADGLQVDVAGRDTLRISARRACIFAAASSDPGRGLPSTNLPLPPIGTIGNDPLCSTASAPSIMAVTPCILLPALSLSHACRGSFCGCA